MVNIKTDNFIATLEEWFKKGPVLSPRFKAGLVKYVPIINLIAVLTFFEILLYLVVHALSTI